ncbi:ferric reductase-like transmembrane domain-containing protein [Conexibacter woesei]|uniref:ferredoxin reductase family protein n=1 Tax=Conexibacter woesei TaxID=191495 RepID=UPI0004209031|nr:ferredoxin reductase family protein [Conexibacter woesei]
MESLWVDHREPEAAPAAAAAPPEAAPAAAPAPVAAERPRRRLPARQRPRAVDALAVAAGLGLGATLALGVNAESAGSLRAAGGWATAGGRLAGLGAAYAMLVVVVLVARCPPLERAVGQDRLVAWHRRLGPYPLYLLCAHATLIVVGYSQAAHDGLLHQLGQLIWTYPGILASTVAFVLLIAAGVTSYRKARRRLAYETWWSVHLYTYLALFLAFSHQVDTGESFVGHPWAKTWWTALWIGALVLVVGCRVALPLWRSVRHQVKVVGIHPEGKDMYSILLEGRRLDRLPIAGGQFLQWRFLRRGLWWQAHPYSLSAAPTGRHLRITVKDLGDHSRALASLAPGTRVAIEGPYGAFTADARQGDMVVLIGAGVGITPIRALLQELPERGVDVEVVLRASAPGDVVLADEVRSQVARRGGRVHELVGPREQVPLDAAALRALVPDIAQRDVYLCGPDGFSEHVAAQARRAGVARDRIHHESFAL